MIYCLNNVWFGLISLTKDTYMEYNTRNCTKVENIEASSSNMAYFASLKTKCKECTKFNDFRQAATKMSNATTVINK